MDFKKLGAKIILSVMSLGVIWTTWVTASIYSVQARADRVMLLETKIDKIYEYIINKKTE